MITAVLSQLVGDTGAVGHHTVLPRGPGDAALWRFGEINRVTEHTPSRKIEFMEADIQGVCTA